MLQTMLIKLGLSLFKLLPLEQIVAKVLTAAIQRIMLSKKTAAQIAQVRKTVIHLTEPGKWKCQPEFPFRPSVFFDHVADVRPAYSNYSTISTLWRP